MGSYTHRQYAPTEDPGDWRCRVHTLVGENPAGGTRLTRFFEEKVVLVEGNGEETVANYSRELVTLADDIINTPITLRHPYTDEVIPYAALASMSFDDGSGGAAFLGMLIHIAIYSLARNAQLAADAAEITQKITAYRSECATLTTMAANMATQAQSIADSNPEAQNLADEVSLAATNAAAQRDIAEAETDDPNVAEDAMEACRESVEEATVAWEQLMSLY